MGRLGEAEARRGRRDAGKTGRGRKEYKERGAGVRVKEGEMLLEEGGGKTHSGPAEGWQAGEKLGRRRKRGKEIDRESENE